MSLLDKANQFFNTIPPEIKSFLKRAFLIFIFWKLLYHLVLYKAGFPNNILTELTGWGTTKMLSLFYPYSIFSYKSLFNESFQNIYTVVYMNSKLILRISPSCNALELYVLYISFLFCFPAKKIRILLFSIMGIFVIYLINILRTAGIAYFAIEHKKWVDFAHHYLFKIVVYGFIFLMWIYFTKGFFYDQKKSNN